MTKHWIPGIIVTMGILAAWWVAAQKDREISGDRRISEAAASPNHSNPDSVAEHFSQSTSSILADLRLESDPATRMKIILAAIGSIRSWEDYLSIYNELDGLDSTENQRLGLLFDATSAASRQGLAQELIDFVNDNIGPGRIKEQLIGSIFSNSAGSPTLRELVELANRLETGEEAAIAIRAMSSSIARASIEELHDFSRMAHGNAELNFSLGRGVSEKFAYGEFLEPPEIESLRSFVHSHAHDDPFVLGVLQYAGDSVIQLLWPEFIEHGVEWQESRSAFVQSAASRAPADTFRRLVEWSHSTPEDIGMVVESWLRDDPISASHEVSRNARLAENPSLHDRAALKIVHYAVAHDERDTAQSWADLITDPAEKEQAVRALQNRR